MMQFNNYINIVDGQSIMNVIAKIGYKPMLIQNAKQLSEAYINRTFSEIEHADGMEKYAIVSYTQWNKCEECVKWANMVDETLERLVRYKVLSKKLVWFDKMAQGQFNASNVVWPATANMQYMVRPVIICLPSTENSSEGNNSCDWHPYSNELEEVLWFNYGRMKEAIEHAFLIKCINVIQIGQMSRCWPNLERQVAAAMTSHYLTMQSVKDIYCSLFVLLQTVYGSLKYNDDPHLKAIAVKLLSYAGASWILNDDSVHEKINVNVANAILERKIKGWVMQYNLGEAVLHVKLYHHENIIYPSTKQELWLIGESVKPLVDILAANKSTISNSKHKVLHYNEQQIAKACSIALGALAVGTASTKQVYNEMDKLTAVIAYSMPKLLLNGLLTYTKSINDNIENKTSDNFFIFLSETIIKQQKNDISCEVIENFAKIPLLSAGGVATLPLHTFKTKAKSGRKIQVCFTGTVSGKLPWDKTLKLAITNDDVEMELYILRLRNILNMHFIKHVNVIAVSYEANVDCAMKPHTCWWCKNIGILPTDLLITPVQKREGSDTAVDVYIGIAVQMNEAEVTDNTIWAGAILAKIKFTNKTKIYADAMVYPYTAVDCDTRKHCKVCKRLSIPCSGGDQRMGQNGNATIIYDIAEIDIDISSIDAIDYSEL